MRPRRGGIQGFATSPVLVGAVTILIVIIAVFLAYNANNGLPFVPTYKVDALVPNANALVKNNEVRVGGVRVGVVKDVTPDQLPSGRVVARLHLSLDKNVRPLPVDSTLVIRNLSAIGLKYVQVVPGDSSRGYKEGATIPLSASKPPTVELDQFFNMFNAPTRKAIRGNLTGFGAALAGRGADLNSAFTELGPLLRSLNPALRNLVSPQTRFGDFWRALAATAAEVAPVAETQASLFVGLDRTFTAFARVARPYIQETIEKSAPTEDTAIDTFPVLRPFLGNLRKFFAALEPGAKALGRTSPVIARALHVGVPVLNDSPTLNAQLEPTAQALVDFQGTSGVVPGIELLTQTNKILDPGLRYIAPAQATCNYLTLLFKNVASIGAQGNSLGTWTRIGAKMSPEGEAANDPGSPSSAPANGPGNTMATGKFNHLHINPYPYTASPGQPASCMAGNEQYFADGPGTKIGNPSKRITLHTAGQIDSQLNPGGK